MHVNRITGEVLPERSQFTHCELGAMKMRKSDGKKLFVRNHLGHSIEDIERFRSAHNNIGVFKTMLMSNEPEYLDKYGDPNTLFLAPLTFDMDASEDPSPESWEQLVREVSLLINYICFVFHIKDINCARIWFSGGRGFHVEFPIHTLGIYAHHDLAKVFSLIGRTLATEMQFKYMDMSLYGSKHLLRLDNSIHQRTNSYKWPLKQSEVLKAYDYQFLLDITKYPRTGFGEKFWPVPEPSKYALAKWDSLVNEISSIPVKPPVQAHTTTPSNYDMHSYRCIEMQFEDGYLVPQGMRYHVAYIIAQHFKQNGFDFNYTEAKLYEWAENKCDPPYNTEEDMTELHRMMSMVYNSDRYTIGCGYIQRNAPPICDAQNCPIGRSQIAKKISLL